MINKIEQDIRDSEASGIGQKLSINVKKDEPESNQMVITQLREELAQHFPSFQQEIEQDYFKDAHQKVIASTKGNSKKVALKIQDFENSG